MDPDADDMQIDPSIAEAMGFSGFGMQTSNKKRKHGDDDTYAFVDTQTQASATGSNSVEIGKGNGNSASTGGKQPMPATGTSQPQAAQPPSIGDDGKPTLGALRHGVKNAQGDMVYFLPSFIEDPWEDLKPR